MSISKYKLKTSVEIGGRDYEIRCEYSVILTIFEALNDPELNDSEKTFVLLNLFYPEFEEIPAEYHQEAVQKCLQYINGGVVESTNKKSPRIVSWEQDFPYIVGAINRILGYDIRNVEYDYDSNMGGVSWETFLAAYYEIGDCLFSQIVSIRNKKARGKKLDKSEQEFYRKNKEIIDIKIHYSEAEEDLVKMWAGG